MKTFCDMFAGIGLVRDALENSGWTCTYANDIDPLKKAMYQARFGVEGHFHLEDVWKTEEVLARIPGRPFLATAGFPCQDLSLAGNCRGLSGKASSAFFAFARVLTALRNRRPPLVLLENVPGLLTSRGGKDFAAVVGSLATLNYQLDAVVLDAEHFVPQSRPRLFVIGVLEGYKTPGAVSQASHDAFKGRLQASAWLRPPRLARLIQQVDLRTGWVLFDIPQPPPRKVLLQEVIDLGDDEEWWGEGDVLRHLAMLSDRHRRLVEELLADGRLHVGTGYRRVRKGQQRLEIRFDGVAGCLRTPSGGSSRQIVVVIDRGRLQMRWMSPREYARLQGAPDYPLFGTQTQLLRGFGDAVCVPVIRWLDHVLTPVYEAAVGAVEPSLQEGSSGQE